MNPSRLRHRITFQKFVSGTDQDGFPTESWEDVKTVWSMVKTIQGREYYAAAAVQAENTVRFVVRYTKEIDSSMRIVYKGRIFEIVAPPINDDEANKTLTIIAKEVVPSD
ncbi:MAG: phage head closure protein [Bacillales bacterium]|nr:phage head closure protein [Bacillales bacterium]